MSKAKRTKVKKNGKGAKKLGWSEGSRNYSTLKRIEELNQKEKDGKQS